MLSLLINSQVGLPIPLHPSRKLVGVAGLEPARPRGAGFQNQRASIYPPTLRQKIIRAYRPSPCYRTFPRTRAPCPFEIVHPSLACSKIVGSLHLPALSADEARFTGKCSEGRPRVHTLTFLHGHLGASPLPAVRFKLIGASGCGNREDCIYPCGRFAPRTPTRIVDTSPRKIGATSGIRTRDLFRDREASTANCSMIALKLVATTSRPGDVSASIRGQPPRRGTAFLVGEAEFESA